MPKAAELETRMARGPTGAAAARVAHELGRAPDVRREPAGPLRIARVDEIGVADVLLAHQRLEVGGDVVDRHGTFDRRADSTSRRIE